MVEQLNIYWLKQHDIKGIMLEWKLFCFKTSNGYHW